MNRDNKLNREIRDTARLNRLGTRSPRCGHCDEKRPPALTRTKDGIICYECLSIQSGRPHIEGHHVAGRKNDPYKIPLPGNHHRCASDLQKDWPHKTFHNPNNSPLRKIAGAFRGVGDLILIFTEYLAGQCSSLKQLNRVLNSSVGIDILERLHELRRRGEPGDEKRK
jgi:hypothetical protein